MSVCVGVHSLLFRLGDVEMIIVQRLVHGKECLGFTCVGHASESRDRTIICAGVSTLVWNTINSINAFTDDTFTIDTSKGSGLIDVRFCHRITDKTKLLLDAMFLGFDSIRDQYGDQHIHILDTEMGDNNEE